MNRSLPHINLSFGLPALLAGVLGGCAVTPPNQEMSEARQSVEAAQDAGARELAPGAMDSAQQLLTQAEAGIRTGAYEAAQKDAIAAREAARQALAISEAKQQQPEETPDTTVVPEPPAVPPRPDDSYTVQVSESLWAIAARREVYGDPLLWPLLLKANQARIADADLIYPNQTLRVRRDYSDEEQTEAVHHAQTRGPWQPGVVEASDTRYLQGR